MPASIQQRYLQLARRLELLTSAGPFTLQDDAFPVVLLGEHRIEKRPQVTRWIVGGVTADGTIVASLDPRQDLDVSSPKPAGFYTVIFTNYARTGVVGDHITQLREITAAGVARILADFFWGSALGETRETITIPSVFIEEGVTLQVVLGGAMVASDAMFGNLLTTPL